MMYVRLFKQSILLNKIGPAVRFMSTKIVLIDNGSTFVAWHPRKNFPYDCTIPLPAKVVEENDSVLKTILSPEIKQIYKKKSQDTAIQELMEITSTTKHRWYPRSRDKKAKKIDPDREFL